MDFHERIKVNVLYLSICGGHIATVACVVSGFHSGIFVKTRNLHEHHIRQSNKFQLPLVKHEFAKSTIQFKISKFFNNIEPSIKNKIYSHSFDGFKRYVKVGIICQYPIDCDIRNCFYLQ